MDVGETPEQLVHVQLHTNNSISQFKLHWVHISGKKRIIQETWSWDRTACSSAQINHKLLILLSGVWWKMHAVFRNFWVHFNQTSFLVTYKSLLVGLVSPNVYHRTPHLFPSLWLIKCLCFLRRKETHFVALWLLVIMLTCKDTNMMFHIVYNSKARLQKDPQRCRDESHTFVTQMILWCCYASSTYSVCSNNGHSCIEMTFIIWLYGIKSMR